MCVRSRWCRFAQPPATRLHPSGMPIAGESSAAAVSNQYYHFYIFQTFHGMLQVLKIAIFAKNIPFLAAKTVS